MAKSEKVSSAYDSAVTLTPHQLQTFIESVAVYSVKNNTAPRPLEILGPPGIGKTGIVKSAAKNIAEKIPGYELIIIAPSTTPADELGGIPLFKTVADDGITVLHYALPYWAITKMRDPNWKGICCFDDARQCLGDQQKNLANMIYERNIRGYDFPDNLWFILTGNRMEDRAGVAKELTHYSGRKTKVELEVSVDDWTVWAVENGVREEVIAFVNYMKAEHFNSFDPDREKNPNPRTWEAVSNWLKVIDGVRDSGISNGFNATYSKYAMALYSGEVGPKAAVDFYAFTELYRNMPDLEDLIKNPRTAKIPERPDMCYAVVTALAARVTGKTLGAILEYCDRISVEHSALVITMAYRLGAEITSQKAFTDWVLKNGKLLITR